MIDALQKTLLAGLAMILPVGECFAAARGYCVQRVGLKRVAAAEPYRQSNGPSQFLLADKARTPLAIDTVKEPAGGDRYFLRQILWRFTSDRRLEGPYDFASYDVRGTDGTAVYLSRQVPLRSTAGGGSAPPPGLGESEIHVVNPGGLPKVVKGPWTGQGWTLRPGGFDPDLGGFRVEAWSNPAKGPQRQRSYLVRGTDVISLGDAQPPPPTKRFPAWHLAVRAKDHQVELIDMRGRAGRDLDLRHAGDLEGWESLNVDRYGWLFAEGWGNDYAIKIDNRAGIKAEKIHRYTGRGWLARFLAWLFGNGGGTPIHRTTGSAQCVDFSPVLALTLFCKPAKVLRRGELADIGDGSFPLQRYAGDATGARVALFTGTDDGLYAFDGRQVQSVAKRIGGRLQVQDIPEAGRTFVTAGAAAYEIRGRFPRLRLAAIDTRAPPRIATKAQCCLSRYGMDTSRFVAFPGTTDILGFNHATGLWLIGGDRVERIWQTQGRQIALAEIAPASIWKGMVFLTMDKVPHLITRCEL